MRALHTAFVFAHPGHEFRLLDHIRSSNATVHIFTRGSRSGTSSARIDASARLCQLLDSKQGTLFGEHSDRCFYTAILQRDFAFFDDIVERLALAFEQDGTDLVVTDSWQNYNPVHDLAHLCARAAVAKTRARSGKSITVYDYPVVLGELALAPTGHEIQRRHLTADALALKLQRLNDYPDIANEAAALLEIGGTDALAIETLHQLLPLSVLYPSITAPYYEQYGQLRVASGTYKEVITWPAIKAIVDHILDNHVNMQPLDPTPAHTLTAA